MKTMTKQERHSLTHGMKVGFIDNLGREYVGRFYRYTNKYKTHSRIHVRQADGKLLSRRVSFNNLRKP